MVKILENSSLALLCTRIFTVQVVSIQLNELTHFSPRELGFCHLFSVTKKIKEILTHLYRKWELARIVFEEC